MFFQLSFGATSAALFIFPLGTTLFADERCQQLEALSQQYAVVELSVAQRQVKRQLIVWYDKNCRARRTAQN
jgi:hypothetical protein